MKTVALRFGEHFAPECGTIVAHENIINQYGYVWYGKLGNALSDKVIKDILSLDEPKILLINSGKSDRYWAKVCEIIKTTPDLQSIPAYYRDEADKFKTWFKIKSFDNAPKDIMSHCCVASSGSPLGEASKHSMSPYFIIEYREKESKK